MSGLHPWRNPTSHDRTVYVGFSYRTVLRGFNSFKVIGSVFSFNKFFHCCCWMRNFNKLNFPTSSQRISIFFLGKKYGKLKRVAKPLREVVKFIFKRFIYVYPYVSSREQVAKPLRQITLRTNYKTVEINLHSKINCKTLETNEPWEQAAKCCQEKYTLYKRKYKMIIY